MKNYLGNMIRTRLLSVLLHTTRDGSVRRMRTEFASHAVIRQQNRQLLIVDSVARTVNNGNFCCFVTSAACSAAGKKPKLEASSADEDSPVKRPGRKSTVFDSSPSPSPQKKASPGTNGGTSPKRRRIVSSSEEDAPEAEKARLVDCNQFDVVKRGKVTFFLQSVTGKEISERKQVH